jgi:hypothetical protein
VHVPGIAEDLRRDAQRVFQVPVLARHLGVP